TRARRRRRRLEQVGVVPLDIAQVRQQDARERIATGEPHEPCEVLQGGAFGRQRMRLLIRHHLQPVLDSAQEPIGGVELRAGSGHGRGLTQPGGAKAARGGRVARKRSSGLRPPAINCWVWTKNSISRMPPRPSFTLWPSTAISP